MFKIRKNKSFNFTSRYYDERKERLENLKEGKRGKIKFTRNISRGTSKGRTLRLTTIIFFLGLFAYLTLIR